MADDNCITCGNLVRPRQHAIQCDLCQKWNHRICGTGISQEQYRRLMKEDNFTWECRHDTIEDVELDPNPTPVFSVIEEGTKRLKRKLTDTRGFTYNVKRTRKDTIDWQCSVRSRVNPCRATVRQHNDSFVPGPAEHNHQAKPGIEIAANMEAQIRKQAKENVFVPASTIVDEAIVVHGNSDAPEHSRPVHMQPIRTNNDVEGWHRRINMKAQDSKPPMYVLVKLLFREASLLPMQLQMVSEGKLRRRCRERTKTQQGQLFKICYIIIR